MQSTTQNPSNRSLVFHKATSNGVVSASDVAHLKAQIDRVYDDADYVGSLVTDPGRHRPTDWTQRTAEWDASPWARPVWEWHQAN